MATTNLFVPVCRYHPRLRESAIASRVDGTNVISGGASGCAVVRAILKTSLTTAWAVISQDGSYDD
jgi:hypothetical protein